MRITKRTIFAAATLILLTVAVFVGIKLLYRHNYIPHKKYSDSDFKITAYRSPLDTDGDGIDDQTDILYGAKAYLATEPEYLSKYYATGYPDDEYGVCTDVVAFAMKAAGYDLMQLVAEDIEANFDDYNIEKPDSNIDFRRVRNLLVYFENTATSLTTDISRIEEWQAGDIVIWDGHIGIISDCRNYKGYPFVLHNGSPTQASYEEDILAGRGEIIGHYRVG
ncbi:MAG: DUF1287 domain-containing protein [Clostridia bacterium]|nr:DUF1287 domain-containing protein [Clostridia bacterium]